jgi:CRP/FNR family cyclic AMP-dependent transcriptional regulator
MPETIVSAMLRRTHLFGDLSLAERLKLAGAFRRRDVVAGAYVFRAGDPGRSFFLMNAGLIKICLTRRGRRVDFAELKPGDYFGELAVIDGRPRSADALAMINSELLELPQVEFFQILEDSPLMFRKLLTELCRRLREADRQISTLATSDATGRIIRGLLTLAERRARREAGDLILDPAPRQSEVAALAGTTRATTSRVLRQLTEQGLISASGSALVLHEGRLMTGDNLR